MRMPVVTPGVVGVSTFIPSGVFTLQAPAVVCAAEACAQSRTTATSASADGSENTSLSGLIFSSNRFRQKTFRRAFRSATSLLVRRGFLPTLAAVAARRRGRAAARLVYLFA